VRERLYVVVSCSNRTDIALLIMLWVVVNQVSIKVSRGVRSNLGEMVPFLIRSYGMSSPLFLIQSEGPPWL